MDLTNIFKAMDSIAKKRIAEDKNSQYLIAIVEKKNENGSYSLNFQEVRVTGWPIDSTTEYLVNDIVYFIKMPNNKNLILTKVK